MNNKTIGIIAVVAIVVVLGAMLVSKDDSSSKQVKAEEKKGVLFPELQSAVNEVTKVVLTDGNETMTLVRLEDTWGLESKANYPVKFDSVRDIVKTVAEMEYREKKTSNPDYHQMLQVQSPDQEGSQSKQVTIYQDDNIVADLIVGKADYSAYDEPHQFVRMSNENQVWLAKGNLSANLTERSYLQTDVVNIDAERIASIAIEHGDGEEVLATRSEPTISAFELKSKPEDRELKNTYVTNEFSRMLSSVRFDSVELAQEIELPDEPTVTFTAATFDGLKLRAEGYDKDSKKYFIISSEFIEEKIEETNSKRRAEYEEMQAAEEQAETGDATEAPELEAGPDLVDPEEIKEESEKLNKQLSKWAYVFPTYVQDRFTRRNEFYLKELEAENSEQQDETVELPTPNQQNIPPEVMEMLQNQANAPSPGGDQE